MRERVYKDFSFTTQSAPFPPIQLQNKFTISFTHSSIFIALTFTFLYSDSKKNLKDVEEQVTGGQRPTINHYMKCRKRRVSARQLEKRQLSIVKTPLHEKGDFAPLPIEVSFDRCIGI